MKKEVFLVAYKAQCKKCKDIIHSKYNHNYVCCSCKSICIDGGHNSPMGNWVTNHSEIISKNIYSDAPFEIIRENLYRNGTTKLSEQSDAWLENMIIYEEERMPDNKFLPIYRKEVEYRKENNIITA